MTMYMTFLDEIANPLISLLSRICGYFDFFFFFFDFPLIFLNHQYSMVLQRVQTLRPV